MSDNTGFCDLHEAAAWAYRQGLMDVQPFDVIKRLATELARASRQDYVEDENGEIVRETMRDSDAITLYKTMRETLVYLTHLDTEDSENIMLSKLSDQCEENSQHFSFYNISERRGVNRA